MEKQTWTGKRQFLAGGCVVVLLLAGFLSGLGLKKFLPAAGEAVSVYSVEGLRDKKWSDAVSLPATVETGSLTAWYYDSRKPVAELYVTEGQKVEAGTILLRYDCTALAEELSGVEKSITNQRAYLERLGGFIGTLRATKPRPDGLGKNREEAGGGLLLASAWTEGSLSVLSGQTAPASAEESLEGFVEMGGQDNAPVVYDRVDETSVPSGGTGTAQDPYVYYVKKGGEVAPEVLAMLARMKLCGRFVVVEDGGSAQMPLLVWTFDGKLYGEIIQGESSSVPESSSVQVSESDPGTETSPEPSAEPSEDSGESGTGEENSAGQTESSTSAAEPAGSTADGNGTETPGTDPTSESPSVPDESSSCPEGETPPDFGGDFDDGALDEALGGLETMPQGYTKEELARTIRERSMEYENLELAIRKNELQAENLKQEIEKNILTAETDGLVRTAMDPKEAARLGQPVLTVQGRSGSFLSGRMNEVLAAALQPGDRLTVSARVREKEVSFEAVLQSVEKEPEDGTDAAPSGGGGMSPGMSGGISGERDMFVGMTEGLSSGNGTGNPAMSYYRFMASPAEKTGLRAGDTVEILIPRTILGQGAAAGRDFAPEGSVILPDTLLFYEGGSAFVYAVDGNGRLEKRPVETGRSFEGTKTEILSGITGEDYLAYPEEAAGMEGAKARIVYGEEMEIKTEESEGWEETGS
ncbi:MAG: biotin/lipoyl-binding protein [Lachnospiraceae bacterium]|jgi:hypothetical protein|nr:biotin/lipoyl-binding protein [Lachnospiraceae bacterium]